MFPLDKSYFSKGIKFSIWSVSYLTLNASHLLEEKCLYCQSYNFERFEEVAVTTPIARIKAVVISQKGSLKHVPPASLGVDIQVISRSSGIKVQLVYGIHPILRKMAWSPSTPSDACPLKFYHWSFPQMPWIYHNLRATSGSVSDWNKRQRLRG